MLTNTAQYNAARKTLTAAMEKAAAREDYATAAQLKRELDHLNAEDPLFLLNEQLQQCVEEQRFQDAALLKQQLDELTAAMGMPRGIQEIQTSSDTLTDGIRVRVQSTYRPAESAPHLGQYFFSYHIVISNEGDKVVQLKNRHWVIRGADGTVNHVRGPGVVGAQPILMPGKSFEYDSACPLHCESGSMEGEFEMHVLSEEDGEFRSKFDALVGPFKLCVPPSTQTGS